jgi:hypothetical protein
VTTAYIRPDAIYHTQADIRGDYVGTNMSIFKAFRVAIDHARGLIEDDATVDCDDEATQEDYAVALEAITKSHLNEAEVLALGRVVALGAEYMANNNYADDGDFPEDQQAALILKDGEKAKLDVYYMWGYPPFDRIGRK